LVSHRDDWPPIALNEDVDDIIMSDSDENVALMRKAVAGDETALRELFGQYRDRLKRMVRLRLSRRLQGRIDDSDVLQESYLEVARRLEAAGTVLDLRVDLNHTSLADPLSSAPLWYRAIISSSLEAEAFAQRLDIPCAIRRRISSSRAVSA
jgi:hypothetical protein